MKAYVCVSYVSLYHFVSQLCQLGLFLLLENVWWLMSLMMSLEYTDLNSHKFRLSQLSLQVPHKRRYI